MLEITVREPSVDFPLDLLAKCIDDDGVVVGIAVLLRNVGGLLERITEPFTLRGLVVELAERGLKVDYRTVWAFVRRTGYSFKKRPNSPRSRTAPT